MKTLLVGGTLDGTIIDTRRNQFGFSQDKEIYDKEGNLVRCESSSMYLDTHSPVRHPCKKIGTVRVFKLSA